MIRVGNPGIRLTSILSGPTKNAVSAKRHMQTMATPNNTISPNATVGFHNATAYDAHRPSYPPEAVEKILAHVGLSGLAHKGARIVDLAAGTGKLTELLAARPEVFEIRAVEPHDTMRQTLEAKNLPGVATQIGTAEAMNVEEGWADLVVAAQAFHWFANEDALREIRRVLKPEGKLAVVWNAETYNKPGKWESPTQWEQKLNDLVIKLATDGQPRFRDYVWKDVFDRQKDLFTTPIGEDSTEWTTWLSIDALWSRLRTLSHLAVLEGEALADFKGKFEDIVKNGDSQWNEKDEVAVHGHTYFSWTTRL